MKKWKEKTWQHETTGIDGNTILFGVNIFDYQWESTNQSVRVRDHLYGQEYEFPIYKVIINEKEYEFAAREFSNCVWGFCILKDDGWLTGRLYFNRKDKRVIIKRPQGGFGYTMNLGNKWTWILNIIFVILIVILVSIL